MRTQLSKLTLAAILAFAFTFTFSCSSDDSNDNSSPPVTAISSSGGSGNLSSPGGSSSSGGLSSPSSSSGSSTNFTLSGQVYTEEMDMETMNFKYVPYTSPNKTFTSNTGATGSITSGNMSFIAGVPSSDILEPFESDIEEMYPSATIQPSDVLGIVLEFLDIDLSKQNSNININIGTGSMTMTTEAVSYLYVDKDCIITATGYIEEGITYSNLNLNLNKGWNAINMKLTAVTTMTNDVTTGTVTMEVGDLPSCKWVLGDDYSGDDDSPSLQLLKAAKLGLKKAIMNANK